MPAADIPHEPNFVTQVNPSAPDGATCCCCCCDRVRKFGGSTGEGGGGGTNWAAAGSPRRQMTAIDTAHNDVEYDVCTACLALTL